MCVRLREIGADPRPPTSGRRRSSRVVECRQRRHDFEQCVGCRRIAPRPRVCAHAQGLAVHRNAKERGCMLLQWFASPFLKLQSGTCTLVAAEAPRYAANALTGYADALRYHSPAHRDRQCQCSATPSARLALSATPLPSHQQRRERDFRSYPFREICCRPVRARISPPLDTSKPEGKEGQGAV